MSNILIVPNSGSIYFSTGIVGSSTIPNLSSGVAFQFDNLAGVNITSYATGVNDNDRFSVDGYNGRLFNVSDNLTGVIFSVNDAAGLPIIEVDSGAVDRITMGTYASNTFVINDNRVGIGTGVPSAKLDIFDNVLAGSAGLSGSILNLNQTWNTTGTPTAIKLNVTDTASNAASKLLDLQLGGVSKFRVDKNGTNLSDGWYFISNSSYWRLQAGGQGYLQIGAGYTLLNNRELKFSDATIINSVANTLEQRNGVNPQAFRLYNTYTSGTHFERLNLRWDTNVVKIGTEKGSAGGVARDLSFETDATTRMTIAISGNIGIGTITPNSKLTVTGGDVEITDTTAGVIFKTPDGTKRYRMTIDNAGAPVFTLLG